MARPTKIKLTELCLDAGTQARVEINQQTVDDYAERMLDGDVFIGVDVWTDGKTKWLSDGFHRYYATKKNGLDTISCKMHDGTLLDAIWDALEANKINGLPRTNADKVRAVEIALVRWPDKSDRELAEHIGVSHVMVGKYRHGKAATVTTPAAPAATPETPQPSTPPKVTSKTDPIGEIPMGIPPVHHEPPAEDWTFDPAKGPDDPGTPDEGKAKPAPLCDKTGVDLNKLHGPTADGIRDAFRRRGEVASIMRQLTTLKKKTLAAAESGDKLYSKMNTSDMQVRANDLRAAFEIVLPYAVCPYCSGDGTDTYCQGSGWIGLWQYKQTPDYMAAHRAKSAPPKNEDEENED